MLTLNKDHPRQPVPDWRASFDDIPFSAKSATQLIEAVTLYRKNNGLPPGAPEHEIAMQLADSHPHLVHADDDDGPTKDIRLWAWVNRIWSSARSQNATPDVVKDRRAACAKCVFALPIPRNPELERRAYLLAAGNLSPETQCSHHRWHNGLAVLPVSPESPKAGAPECCWVAAEAGR